MPFLLIFRSDETPFEPSRFIELLRATDQASRIQDSGTEGALVSAHFKCGADSAIVELKADRRSIAISDYGAAGFQFAFLLQQSTSVPLRIVDEAYTFDLNLRDFGSPDQLEAAIRSNSIEGS